MAAFDALPRRRTGWRTAGAALWALTGATYGFAVGSLPSIGLFLLAPAALLTIALARTPRTSRAWPAAIAGLAVPLLYIAYLNRSGPGTVCTTTATSQSCMEEYAPAFFLVAAGVVLVVSVLLFARAQRGQPPVRRPMGG
jgi:hypothetical protein